MHNFFIILFCIGIGILSRLLFLLTDLIGKRTTALNRFFLDLAWSAAAPLLLFGLILLFNRGIFVIHMPLFIGLGFLAAQIFLSGGKGKIKNKKEEIKIADAEK